MSNMTTKERLVKILDGHSDAEHIAELLMENGVIFNDEMKRRIMQATKSDVYCPYCHKSDPRPLNAETVKYSGLEVSMVARSTVLRVRNFPDDECVHFDHQDAIIINYCPMCGRHLHSTV